MGEERYFGEKGVVEGGSVGGICKFKKLQLKKNPDALPVKKRNAINI